MGWISVKDRLPKETQSVLAWFPAHKQAQSCWIEKTDDGLRAWDACFSDLIGEPTHWMPLPAPPTEDANGKEG